MIMTMTKTLNEAAGMVFMGKNLKPEFDENLLLENLSKKREEEKVQEEASALLIKLEQEKQLELEAKLEKLELMPIGSKVILLPYPNNPYKKTITKSGLFVDYDGSFMNPDSGEKDNMKQGIKCAKVIEVGPDCKMVRAGDDVFYESRAIAPIPFFSLGYEILVEGNIFCILNEGLKARLNT